MNLDSRPHTFVRHAYEFRQPATYTCEAAYEYKQLAAYTCEACLLI